MELKSVSGFICYVKDIDKTAEFYEGLGFRIGTKEDDYLSVYLNWFSIEFMAQDKEGKPDFKKEAQAEPKGIGIFINVKVADVDEAYKAIVAKHLKPSSEPRDWPWGNREFVLRDPDGYKLVFWNKAK